MGIRTDLLVTEEIAESSDLRATPFECERAKRVEAALSILEGKWKIVILNRLFARPIWRFSELELAVPGISQRMLSQQLRLLEKCELVKRTVHPTAVDGCKGGHGGATGTVGPNGLGRKQARARRCDSARRSGRSDGSHSGGGISSERRKG